MCGAGRTSSGNKNLVVWSRQSDVIRSFQSPFLAYVASWNHLVVFAGSTSNLDGSMYLKRYIVVGSLPRPHSSLQPIRLSRCRGTLVQMSVCLGWYVQLCSAATGLTTESKQIRPSNPFFASPGSGISTTHVPGSGTPHIQSLRQSRQALCPQRRPHRLRSRLDPPFPITHPVLASRTSPPSHGHSANTAIDMIDSYHNRGPSSLLNVRVLS